MKLTLEKLRHLEPAYKTSVAMNLDSQNLRDFDVISQECEQLQLLSLRYNQIQSLRPLQMLNNLWVIDLQQNHITNFEMLGQFKVLGYLSLTINNTNVASIHQLRNVFIVQLNLVGSQVDRKQILKQLPRVWVLNNKYVTQVERREAQLAKNLPITQSSSYQMSENILIPLSIYMNERAQEFLEHFGQTHQLLKYYNCEEDVPFDSSEFYDFEEKKFYYLISHTDYCYELELLISYKQVVIFIGITINQCQNHLPAKVTKKCLGDQDFINCSSRSGQPQVTLISYYQWCFSTHTQKAYLINQYLQQVNKLQLLKQMLELILKDNNQPFQQAQTQPLSHEAQVLVYQLPPHLQMGLTIFLRQDLINNLNEEEQLPPLIINPTIYSQTGAQSVNYNGSAALSPMSFGGMQQKQRAPSQMSMGVGSGPLTAFGSAKGSIQIQNQFSSNSNSTAIDKINQEKMLQILECLNINNLIYKFSDVQKNIEAGKSATHSNQNSISSDKNKKQTMRTSSQNVISQIYVPTLIEFPIKELERDNELEVIEILKERRRAICEFIIKIMSSFKILEHYFIEGNMGSIKNILSILDHQQRPNQGIAFFEKYVPMKKPQNTQNQKTFTTISHQNDTLQKISTMQMNQNTSQTMNTQSFGAQVSFQSPPLTTHEQLLNQASKFNKLELNKLQKETGTGMGFIGSNRIKPLTGEMKQLSTRKGEQLEDSPQRKTADFTNPPNNYKELDRSKQAHIRVPTAVEWNGQSPQLMFSDQNSISTKNMQSRRSSRDKLLRQTGANQLASFKPKIGNQSNFIVPIQEQSLSRQQTETPYKKIVYNQYLQQHFQPQSHLINIQVGQSQNSEKPHSAISNKSGDQTTFNGGNYQLSQQSNSNTILVMNPRFQQSSPEMNKNSNMPPSVMSLQNPGESFQISSHISTNQYVLKPVNTQIVPLIGQIEEPKQLRDAESQLQVDTSRQEVQDGHILPILKKSQSLANVGSAPFKQNRLYTDSLVPHSDQKRGQLTSMKSQKSLADLCTVQIQHQQQLSTFKKTFQSSNFHNPQMKATEKSAFLNQQIALSQQSFMNSQANTSNYILVDAKRKKGQVRTRDLWAGIHRTQDLVKCFTSAEHVKRVITRENTPWIQHSMIPHFEKRKDPFVQKYQILLNHVQREKELQRMAENEREKVIVEAHEKQKLQQEIIVQQQPNVMQEYNAKLRHHFDNYIKALALNKQRITLDSLPQDLVENEKSIYEYYQEQQPEAIANVEFNQGPNDNPYFITQKDQF